VLVEPGFVAFVFADAGYIVQECDATKAGWR